MPILEKMHGACRLELALVLDPVVISPQQQQDHHWLEVVSLFLEGFLEQHLGR